MRAFSLNASSPLFFGLPLQLFLLAMRTFSLNARAGGALEVAGVLGFGRLGHAHDLVGDPVGFLLVLVSGLIDPQLGLSPRRRRLMHANSAKMVTRVCRQTLGAGRVRPLL